MSVLLQKISNWKFILPLFILFCLFSFIIFPYYQSRMAAIAGENIEPLDIRFSYTTVEVKKAFETLTAEGRAIYRFVTAEIDMIYPVVYGLTFILVLANLVKKMWGADSKCILLAFFPLTGVLFDYLENFNTLELLKSYPDISPASVSYGEQLTRLKHGMLFLSLALIIVLAISLMVTRLFMNKKELTPKHTRSV